MSLFIGGKLLIPALLRFFAFFTGIPGVINLFRDLKWRMVPAQFLPCQRHFFFPQWCAVRLFLTCFIRRTKANHRTADNQRRLIFHALRFKDRFLHRLRIVTVDFMDHMPVIGFKTFCRIVGKPAFGFTVDGNTVVIVKTNQLAQSQRARQRTDFVGNTFHQAAVAHKHIGEVIDNFMIRLIKLRRQCTLCYRQPDGVRQTLSKRTGGGFNTWRIANLRVAWGFRMQLTEVLQFFQRQVVTGQM